MGVRSISETMDEMFKYYRKHPKLQRDWRVLAGTDDYGYSDLFFYGPGVGIWQVKGEMKNPYEFVGAGARLHARKIDDEIRKIMEQGMPMPFGLISPHPRHKDRAIIAAGVGRYQESMDKLRETLPSKYRDTERDLKRKLDEIRKRSGLDAAYR